MTKSFIPVLEKTALPREKNPRGTPRKCTEIENPADYRLGFQSLHVDKQKFLN